MNVKDEGSTVKRGLGENRRICAGMMERPSFGVQAPWRISFDTQWHHHMGKRPLKPQLKVLSLCRSLSTAWERSIKRMHCPLGLKTHHCSHWGKMMSAKLLSGVHCRCKYIRLCTALCALPNIAASILLCSIMLFLLQSVSEHRGEMGRWEKRKSTEQYQKST